MIDTKFWRVEQQPSNNLDLEFDTQIQEAAAFIRNGETVAFPTETVYGLGANAMSDEAIQKIYEAKGRPGDNPLIVHIADRSQLSEVVSDASDSARSLIDAFWPGPLTVVLPTAGGVSKKVTAGLDTVAVRMPNHPIALALLRAAKVPIAAPSANQSGKPSPTSARHVLDDLGGKIAGIIDGGPTGVGVESTVVDTTSDPVTLLRPGGITQEQLIEVLGKLNVDPALEKADITPKSPGMKYRHYAPVAPLVLVNGPAERLCHFITQAKREGKKVGVLATEENRHAYPDADAVTIIGKRSDLSSVAHGLYEALRYFDEKGVSIIYSETFPVEGIGGAIMNRLKKAAAGQIL